MRFRAATKAIPFTDDRDSLDGDVEEPKATPDLAALTADPRARRDAERRSFLHAVRPIASDLGATLLFYLVLASTGDARAAVIAGVALGAFQIGRALLRREAVAPLQWAGFALVVVLGAATIATRDPRFVLVKATVVYAILGGTMLRPGWMRRYLPPLAVGRVPWHSVRRFERLWAALLLGTGVANLLLAFTLEPQVAALAMGVWAPGSKLALFAVQYARFRQAARAAIRRELGAA